MNPETAALANSRLMLVLCGIPILIIAVQAVVFLVKGWKEAARLGISTEVRRKVITNSALFSIVPSLPIVIIMAVLLPALGNYLPWLRLSVVGSAMYESAAADMTVKTFGLSGISDTAMDPSIFISVAWVMTLGVIAYPVANVLFLKRYSTKVRTAQDKGGFLRVGIPSLFVGLMGVFAVPYLADLSSPTRITTVVVAGAVVMGMIAIAGRMKITWLKDFAFPLSMLVGMASAILFDWILA